MMETIGVVWLAWEKGMEDGGRLAAILSKNNLKLWKEVMRLREGENLKQLTYRKKMEVFKWKDWSVPDIKRVLLRSAYCEWGNRHWDFSQVWKHLGYFLMWSALTIIVLTAKCPCGDVSVRRNVLRRIARSRFQTTFMADAIFCIIKKYIKLDFKQGFFV